MNANLAVRSPSQNISLAFVCDVPEKAESVPTEPTPPLHTAARVSPPILVGDLRELFCQPTGNTKRSISGGLNGVQPTTESHRSSTFLCLFRLNGLLPCPVSTEAVGRFSPSSAIPHLSHDQHSLVRIFLLVIRVEVQASESVDIVKRP